MATTLLHMVIQRLTYFIGSPVYPLPGGNVFVLGARREQVVVLWAEDPVSRSWGRSGGQSIELFI